MNNKNTIKYNKGAAMIVLVVFFVFISLSILVGVVGPTVREFKIASDSFKSKQTYFLAESGVEDVLYRLKNKKQTNETETLEIGDSQVSTTINDITGNKKEIISLGDTDSIQRKVSITLDTGVGSSFSYGVQVGSGGFSMNNGSKIIGSVYSNGPISGSGYISGSATSANTPSAASDQSNGYGVPAYDVSFGNANATQDYGQSFQVSETGVLNKIDLYLKKVGNPSNMTVRIMTDSDGKPSATTLTSATIATSLLSINYGWVEVPFTSFIQLSEGTTYWIVLDASTNASAYFKIGANDNGYINGINKIKTSVGVWNNTTPETLDAYFNVYLGGLMGSITGVTVGTDATGNTYAHTVENATIAGTNYCQTGTGNNKTCDTSRSDPVQVPMPISEQNIEDWKNVAVEGGIISGDYTTTSNVTMGPKKITGNLFVGNGNTLTMTGIIWVQGDLILNNNAIMRLSSDYGTSDGIIVVDGTISLSNNVEFIGSGETGSYLMALTTSSSANAINLDNNSGAVSLYAANGTINVANNGTAISLTGYNIHLGNNAVITYQEGLANANFSSGPSGTWKVNSWKEVE